MRLKPSLCTFYIMMCHKVLIKYFLRYNFISFHSNNSKLIRYVLHPYVIYLVHFYNVPLRVNFYGGKAIFGKCTLNLPQRVMTFKITWVQLKGKLLFTRNIFMFKFRKLVVFPLFLKGTHKVVFSFLDLV